MFITEPMTKFTLLAPFALLLFMTACVPRTQSAMPKTDLPQKSSVLQQQGIEVDPLPYTFQQPTQFFVDDNLLWVAQLNGGENQGHGQVVTVHLQTGEQRVVIDKLDKPTGIALIDDTLWIATRDALLKLNLADKNRAAETVLSDLPTNGRSNGTLTVTPAGKLLFETSGNSFDRDSGKLWELDPQTNARRIVATGLKGAYAHVFDQAGRIWLTEIADGSVEGVVLPDEINLIMLNDDEIPDFGWPRCYGQELSGPDCTGVRAAVTTLPTHSTPTGIALSPFSPNTLLVALWVTGQVVEIPFMIDGENAIGDPRILFDDLRNPQHIETQADGTVLISDFATGQIFQARRSD